MHTWHGVMIKKTLRYVAGTVAVLVLSAALFSLFCFWQVASSDEVLYMEDQQSIPKADAVIIPGAKVADGIPSDPLKDRVETAVKLYRWKKARKFYLSGGKDETEVMKKMLLLQNIPEDSIVVDEGGMDTYDTIFRIRSQAEDKTFLISTQEQYAKRTAFLAEKLQLKARCVRADQMFYKSAGKTKVREYFACTKAWLEVVLFKPEPYYSLRELPIRGENDR
ncbi:SanA/YdcF family protein [Anaerostipes sp.]|uniref:SanA/YdcF family protein n=1 Tax=Anaerostipes sp. TaxID=1872530 RepID=UPI0025BAB068|nr:ElyC/SanA/YdcF family protein [Anaerostipes sp.]MBS7009340.1 YdcF family protein [Anaerostipes sp.]